MFPPVVTVLAWSIAASLATAFAFAMSTMGRISIATLVLPGVSTIAAIFGSAAGVVLWPYMFWCLKGRNPVPTVLVLIALAVIVVSVITVFSPRIGLVSSLAFWLVALFVVRTWLP